MFLTLLVLLLVAFIPFQVYKAIVAWRLTKGIKEFKEQGFRGSLPSYNPHPSELGAGLWLMLALMTVGGLLGVDSHVLPYLWGGLVAAAIIPVFFFNKDISEGVPEKPCSEPSELLFGCDVLIHGWWVEENPHALWEYGYKKYGKIMVSSILGIIASITLITLAVVAPNTDTRLTALESMPDTKIENGVHQTVTIKRDLRELEGSTPNQQTNQIIQGAGWLPSSSLTDTGDKQVDRIGSPVYTWVQDSETPISQEVTYKPGKYLILEDQEPGKAYVELTPMYRVSLTVFDGQPLCVEGRDTGCSVNAWDSGHVTVTFHVPKGEAKKYLKKSI